MGNLKEVLGKYLPTGSVDYAHDLLWKYGIQLHIKKPRTTKFGDYRYPRPGEPHRISVNNNLNPYAFLVTFLHEAAHLVNFEKRGRHNIKPHGKEWKLEFREIATPVLNKEFLPEPVLYALDGYLSNPKASSCTDPKLFRTLKKYDLQQDIKLMVEEVPMEGNFRTKDGRVFKKVEKLRSRYRCIEVKTAKIYLVPGLMEVELV